MIELVWPIETASVITKFEKDLWKNFKHESI